MCQGEYLILCRAGWLFRLLCAYVKFKNHGMNYGFFDAEVLRRRLQGLTDDELITMDKTVSPEASRGKIPRQSPRALASTRFVRKSGSEDIREIHMKQYFFTHDDPPSQPMVGQHDARHTVSHEGRRGGRHGKICDRERHGLPRIARLRVGVYRIEHSCHK